MAEEKVESTVVDDDQKFKEEHNNKHKSYTQSMKETIFSSLNGFLTFLALLAFILIGTIAKTWYNAWIVFFVPDIVCSIIRAIKKKRLCLVNITFICCFIFFFVCMVVPGMDAKLWHPMWVVFLAIPAWYIFFGQVDHNYHKDDKK